MIQVIRNTAEIWRITVTREMGVMAGQRATEYEEIGRVVLESGLFWAERAEWAADGITWRREWRGRATLKAATADLVSPRTKA